VEFRINTNYELTRIWLFRFLTTGGTKFKIIAQCARIFYNFVMKEDQAA